MWRLDYRHSGKRKTLSIGPYPSVSLAEARDVRDGAKQLLRTGGDPGAVRRAGKAKTTAAPDNLFTDVAKRWFAARVAGWSKGYGERVWSRIEADIIPVIGAHAVETVDSDQILRALRAIEERGAVETAHRVKNYVQDIFRYAKSQRLVKMNPADDLTDALATPLPPTRRAALKARDVPQFLADLRAYDGDARTMLAVGLTLLTFVRTSEVRFARWEEFEQLEGDQPLWRISAERMKMRTEHLVPLAPQAVALLRAIRSDGNGDEFLFPAPTKTGVISENTMLFALYRMGYHRRATIHGFRGLASTVLNEHGFNRDWIERQLAHTEQDDVRAAYNSAEWLPQRREMMKWWADYLDTAAHGLG